MRVRRRERGDVIQPFHLCQRSRNRVFSSSVTGMRETLSSTVPGSSMWRRARSLTNSASFSLPAAIFEAARSWISRQRPEINRVFSFLISTSRSRFDFPDFPRVKHTGERSALSEPHRFFRGGNEKLREFLHSFRIQKSQPIAIHRLRRCSLPAREPAPDVAPRFCQHPLRFAPEPLGHPAVHFQRLAFPPRVHGNTMLFRVFPVNPPIPRDVAA